MALFYVYILYSKSLDKYYKGFSSDVEKRLIYHLEGNHKYTSQVRDWELVYKNGFTTKKEALIEEKRIKRLNRPSLEKLIQK